MPGLYQTISDWYPHKGFEQKIEEAINSYGHAGTSKVVGLQIMKTAPKDFVDLFNKFVDYIHTKGYVWNPSGRGGSGYPLLDGTEISGECAMFARAFFILAFAPSPYGLGIPKTELEFVTVFGVSKMGFVGPHPENGVMALKPNVKGQKLYLWSTHKVVRYRNMLYDVMYNTTYASEKDMVAYEIIADESTDQEECLKAEAIVQGLTAGTFYFKATGNDPYTGPLNSK